MSFQFSIILAFMGRLKDRFSFYQQERTLEEKMALVAQVEGVTGVEMVYPNELSDVPLAKDLLAKYNLHLSAVNVNLKGESCWHQGALTALDKATRDQAVQWLQHGMDIAAELGSNLVTVCPLADGHDYPFEIDYIRAWNNFIQCIQAAADYRPEVRLSLEYKASEPRARVIIGNVSKSLYACIEVDRPNVGVTLDIGHALYGGEDSAESATMLTQADKLYLVHGNDNYRNWDWDMIPGSVNFWDFIESTYYLMKGYDGWIAFDVFPARLDPVETMRSSLRMYRMSESIIRKIGQKKLAQSIESEDVVHTMELFQSYLEGNNP